MELKPGYKVTEVGVIPEDWEPTKIGDLFTFKNGLNKAKQFFGQGTPIVNYMNVFARPAICAEEIDGRVEVSPRELAAYEVRRGDVFFTRTSETVDEIGIAAVMLDKLEKTVFSGFILRGRPIDDSLDDLFKAYCFSPRYFRSQVTARASYTTRALTNGRSLSAAILVRPPLPEQRAISTVLSDVDALIESLDRLIAKKRDVKQATMQQLLTGKTRLPGFSGEWEVKRLGEVVDIDPENLASDTRPNFAFNYISLEDVDRGFLRSYSEEIFANAPSRARRKLRANDVLVSTVRPNLQSHLLFVMGTGDWVCSTGFCVVRCREGITDPGYIFAHLFAGTVTQQIESLLTGSNYPAINSGDVRSLKIPIPKYAEQRAIATILSDLDAEIAALEARRDKTRALKQGMMQELLTGRTRLVRPEVTHG